MLLESTFYYLFCLKFSSKLVTFPKSYARKHKWVCFFQNTVCIDEFNVTLRLRTSCNNTQYI